MFILYNIDKRCCTEINDSCENELKNTVEKKYSWDTDTWQNFFLIYVAANFWKQTQKNLLIICKTRKCTKMTNEFWKMTKKEKYKCIFSGNGNITMALGIP